MEPFWSRLIERCMSRTCLVVLGDRLAQYMVDSRFHLKHRLFVEYDQVTWSPIFIYIYIYSFLRFLDMLGIISGILNCSSYIFPWNTCHIVLKLLQSVFFSYAWCLGLALFFFWLMFGPLWRLLGCFFGVWSRGFSPRCRGTVWRWSSHKVDLVLDLPVPVLRVQDAKFVSLSLGMAEWVVWPNLWYRKKRGELMDGWLMMNHDS